MTVLNEVLDNETLSIIVLMILEPPLFFIYINDFPFSLKKLTQPTLLWMRWAGHVARMGENRNAYRILVACQKERDHWEDQDESG
jgi:hypothetical protein